VVVPTRWRQSTAFKSTRYNTLQQAASHRNTPQHTATQKSLLWSSLLRLSRCASDCIQTYTQQHTATHCNTLQHKCNTLKHKCNKLQYKCNTLHHKCNTLQHKCNTLHHTATHCITLQHTATQVQHTATHRVTLQHRHLCCGRPNA